MPNNGSTEHEDAAKMTANLVDHDHTPNRISDAVLETLIEMSAESQITIWHAETGLSVESLAALDSMPTMNLGEWNEIKTGNYK